METVPTASDWVAATIQFYSDSWSVLAWVYGVSWGFKIARRILGAVL